MLTFEQIIAFRAIILAGGFTRAADKLFLTQPAISQRIRHLEQALGTKLFCQTSSRRPLQLTQAGEEVFKFAEELAARLETLHQVVRTANDLQQPATITVAASQSGAKYVLPCLLAVYHKRFPHVRVHVIHCLSCDINELVHLGEAEFGVQVNCFADNRFDITPLISTRLVLIAVPDHPVAKEPQRWLVGQLPIPLALDER